MLRDYMLGTTCWGLHVGGYMLGDYMLRDYMLEATCWGTTC